MICPARIAQGRQLLETGGRRAGARTAEGSTCVCVHQSQVSARIAEE